MRLFGALLKDKDIMTTQFMPYCSLFILLPFLQYLLCVSLFIICIFNSVLGSKAPVGTYYTMSSKHVLLLFLLFFCVLVFLLSFSTDSRRKMGGVAWFLLTKLLLKYKVLLIASWTALYTSYVFVFLRHLPCPSPLHTSAHTSQLRKKLKLRIKLN